uniref:Uncharacterized protein n=1 Tax=Avena sativa TaxID=4498 RepID=A0ACD5ZFM8_AVESA
MSGDLPALQARPVTSAPPCAARCGASSLPIYSHHILSRLRLVLVAEQASSSSRGKQTVITARTAGAGAEATSCVRGEEMGAASMLSGVRRRCHCSFLLLAFLLCSSCWFVRPSQAFKRGGYDQEKVPLSFIVADPTPAPSPRAAPPPVTGADNDDGGMKPRLPTERWRRGRGEERRGRGNGGQEWHRARAPAHAPSSAGPAARAPASADAPAPDSGSGSGTPFIESSPAVPVPRGVRDTATILPMPAPGVKRQDVGGAALVRPAGMVPVLVVVGLIMMASLGALC